MTYFQIPSPILVDGNTSWNYGIHPDCISIEWPIPNPLNIMISHGGKGRVEGGRASTRSMGVVEVGIGLGPWVWGMPGRWKPRPWGMGLEPPDPKCEGHPGYTSQYTVPSLEQFSSSVLRSLPVRLDGAGAWIPQTQQSEGHPGYTRQCPVPSLEEFSSSVFRSLPWAESLHRCISSGGKNTKCENAVPGAWSSWRSTPSRLEGLPRMGAL